MLHKLARGDVLCKFKTDAPFHTLALTLLDDVLADRLTKVEVHMRGNALAKVDSKAVAQEIAL